MEGGIVDWTQFNVDLIIFFIQEFYMMVESYVLQISDQCPHLIIHNLTNMSRLYRNTHQYLTN